MVGENKKEKIMVDEEYYIEYKVEGANWQKYTNHLEVISYNDLEEVKQFAEDLMELNKKVAHRVIIRKEEVAWKSK